MIPARDWRAHVRDAWTNDAGAAPMRTRMTRMHVRGVRTRRNGLGSLVICMRMREAFDW